MSRKRRMRTGGTGERKFKQVESILKVSYSLFSEIRKITNLSNITNREVYSLRQ